MTELNKYFTEAKRNIELAHDAAQRGLYLQAEDHALNAQIELRLLNTALRLKNIVLENEQTT